MNLFRWILFIPFGLIAGVVFALPINIFYGLFNQDNIFFLSLIKNGTTTYFAFLCMAWIVPGSFDLSGFMALVSMMFGGVIVVSAGALISAGSSADWWEFSGEVIGITLGYLVATRWDKHSIKNLLSNQKGVHPYNAYKAIEKGQ